MRWTCPKCGKKLNISNEQLIANDGVIVCPQCLLQARQPIPKARVTDRDDQPKSVPKRPQQTISFSPDTPPEYKSKSNPSTTPPPHKTRMKPASTSYRYTGLSGSDSTPQKRKSSGKKKSKKKKKQQGMSGWGCLGRTVVFTLVLFAAYVFFGLLLEALQ